MKQLLKFFVTPDLVRGPGDRSKVKKLRNKTWIPVFCFAKTGKTTLFIITSILYTLSSILVSADQGPPIVQLTEIAPHKINEEEEWWEFRVQSAEVVMQDWKIKDKNEKIKKFSDFKDQLVWSSDVIIKDLETLHFELPQGEAFFAWTKSPISLPNAGGLIEILDGEGLTLAKAEYPKLKSGTRDKHKYAEVWTWDNKTNHWYPRLHRPHLGGLHLHSKLRDNPNAPTFPGNDLLISEVAMNRDRDFIELYAKSDTRLQYLIVKHNGSVVYQAPPTQTLDAGEYLVIYPEKGLSGGSGTVEIVAWSGTSWEQITDVVCYRKTDLSKTESKRVEKYRSMELWKSDCASILGWKDNISLARNTDFTDQNKVSDFFAHIQGSPGAINTNHNHPPTAVITLQGVGEIVRKVPFSVNVNGEDSTDPQGTDDIIDYQWWVNNAHFTDKPNPGYYRITNPGEYIFKLQVADFSGLIDTEELVIEAVEKVINDQLLVNSQIEKTQKPTNNYSLSTNHLSSDPFFSDFLKTNPIPSPTDDSSLITNNSAFYHHLTAREKLAHWERVVSEKNLSTIFLEN